MLKKIIGAQILEVAENYIDVKKDGKEFRLEIISDDGDCCGYADFETKFLYDAKSLKNPIITDIKNIKNEKKNEECGEESLVTFFGEQKELATIKSDTGSISGWNYGACVEIKCKLLDIDETLASW